MKDIFSERYSCRAYDNGRPVEREKLMRVLEAARLAPSACNRQPWSFVVVDSSDGRKAVEEAYDREWIRTAPLFIIAFGHHGPAWHRPCDGKDHTDIDLAIAVEHICLAATAEGLCTCWVCNFDPEAIRRHFNPAPDVEPVAIIPIGYPVEGAKAPAKVRKPFEDIVKWNKL